MDVEMLLEDGTPFLLAINNNQNPFPWGIKAAHDSIYPQMPPSFTRQLWWLVALFTVSMTMALVGLILRLAQGHFWIVHRMDSRITMPNISIQNSFWAFLYSLMSIIELVITSRIVSGSVYPSWYIGYQGFLPVVLFLGQYPEIWATASAWCLRKYGPHRHDSGLISACFTALPFLWPIVAVSPPIIFFSLAARALGGVHGGVGQCIVNIKALESSWTSGATMDTDLAQLVQALHPLAAIAAYAQIYALWSRVAFRFVGSVLVITFMVCHARDRLWARDKTSRLKQLDAFLEQLYVIATVIEYSHLSRQVRILRRKAGLGLTMAPNRMGLFPGKMFCAAPPSAPTSAKFAVQIGSSNNNSANTQLEQQARLMAWATSNRLLAAVPVSLMLSANAALAFWSSVTPIKLSDNDGTIQIIGLVAAWINSICSTVVAVLILFRALSRSSTTTEAVKRLAPWLPLAPMSTALTGLMDMVGAQASPLSQNSAKKDLPPGLTAQVSVTSEGSEKLTVDHLQSGITGITIERYQQVTVD
ncbi:BZ3500_MvSof-1268-A1-R1_Chr7-1g09140 [Microbotryum saponariae]|uniref:BZ3500_MvSof-1268-A1-R1_Chr7-1g09140 protein n=1 Tax=Microbotryum saponariae TaxID=289078 RepID=A0A2X0LDG8_9BASI|nr:BZ3501_MvSof-1269-A2-R1_Chr7-1g08845 [Microbotryum saponariae]SDA02878.1 BZ3500_MvSof-1268-A1-R1_Chr7-1g09140 [Microbotryum saponariae]